MSKKGYKMTQEHKNKIRNALLGKLSPTKGIKRKPHTEEAKRKMSIALKGRIAWNKGISMNLITKEKMINALKGRHLSPNTEFKKGHKINLGKKRSIETCLNISKGHLGHIPWNKGIPCSEKIKEKLKLANLGKNLSEETKLKIKNALKGKNRGFANGMWRGGEIKYGKYVYITTDDGKYITEHRYIMEKYLKRKLNKDEIIHHKNHIRHDNRIGNLEVMDKKEHSQFHCLEIKPYLYK